MTTFDSLVFNASDVPPGFVLMPGSPRTETLGTARISFVRLKPDEGRANVGIEVMQGADPASRWDGFVAFRKDTRGWHADERFFWRVGDTYVCVWWNYADSRPAHWEELLMRVRQRVGPTAVETEAPLP